MASRSTASTSAAARSRGVRRLEHLVGDHPQVRAVLAGAAEHPLDEVAALRGAAGLAVEPGRADDERAGAVGERGVLAGELRDRVPRPRRRDVVLAVGLVDRRPVEDVVRRQVDELRAAPREVGDRADVHRERRVGLALAHVEVVERRAVEDDVRATCSNARVDAPRVGDVELGVREARRRRRPAAPADRRRADHRRR